MIRMLTVVMVVLMPAVLFGQDFKGMNEDNMQKMMQQVMKAQACIAKVDQTELKAIEQQSNEFEAEVKALCASGKRDKAQKKAMAFGKEMAKKPVLKEMKKCGELMQGAIPGTEMPSADEEIDYSKHHICDE